MTIPAEHTYCISPKRAEALSVLRLMTKQGYGWENIYVRLKRLHLSDELTKEQIRQYVLMRGGK